MRRVLESEDFLTEKTEAPWRKKIPPQPHITALVVQRLTSSTRHCTIPKKERWEGQKNTTSRCTKFGQILRSKAAPTVGKLKMKRTSEVVKEARGLCQNCRCFTLENRGFESSVYFFFWRLVSMAMKAASSGLESMECSDEMKGGAKVLRRSWELGRRRVVNLI